MAHHIRKPSVLTEAEAAKRKTARFARLPMEFGLGGGLEVPVTAYIRSTLRILETPIPGSIYTYQRESQVILVNNRLWPCPDFFIGGKIMPSVTTLFIQKSPPGQIRGVLGSDMRNSIRQFFTGRDCSAIEHRLI